MPSKQMTFPRPLRAACEAILTVWSSVCPTEVSYCLPMTVMTFDESAESVKGGRRHTHAQRTT
ncbi:hypothetical protein L798_11448 [Zootermopsis nevadensis]|uniref:Uncharacterized protein n=1 Tax=Zootermopsis nevadensis TaxID=136037 RepID=A0A067QU22_ZOONE|nr:hypothetical protein L798_11448 [Zootermopsis nevadensis]